MKTTQKLALLILISFISACSGIRVEQDYSEKTDFSRLRYYAWQSDKQKASGDVRVDSSLLNNRIREAIDDSLSAKGYRKTSRKQADFLVAYHYVIREKDENNRVRTGFSIGTGSRGSFGGIHLGMGGGDREQDESELTIDLINPADGQIIWRGVAGRKLVHQSDPSKRTARINETVRAVLKKFPPG